MTCNDETMVEVNDMQHESSLGGVIDTSIVDEELIASIIGNKPTDDYMAYHQTLSLT